MKLDTKNLKEFVEHSIASADENREELLHQVNCRINLEQLFMLEKLSQRLGQSRSSLAGNLLGVAIYDAWFLANMPSVFDEDPVPEMEGKYDSEGLQKMKDEGLRLPAFFGVGKTKLEYIEFCKKYGVTVS